MKILLPIMRSKQVFRILTIEKKRTYARTSRFSFNKTRTGKSVSSSVSSLPVNVIPIDRKFRDEAIPISLL